MWEGNAATNGSPGLEGRSSRFKNWPIYRRGSHPSFAPTMRTSDKCGTWDSGNELVINLILPRCFKSSTLGLPEYDIFHATSHGLTRTLGHSKPTNDHSKMSQDAVKTKQSCDGEEMSVEIWTRFDSVGRYIFGVRFLT